MATDNYELIVQDFEFLDTWEDRYGYIIDLGKQLDSLEEVLKVPATKVEGCASQVWMIGEVYQCNGLSAFRFRGDSDAIIVRGLIAVLKALYNDTNLEYVSKIDAHTEFKRLGLEAHLSAQRSNGLRSMVRRIQAISVVFLQEISCQSVNSLG